MFSGCRGILKIPPVGIIIRHIGGNFNINLIFFKFYKKIFGLHVVTDFGANKTLTGGLSLQTLETYKDFIGTNEISFGGNNFEIYFEEDDFDSFIDKLQNYDIEYVHPVKEHSWEQLVVRLYYPDKHIIEVGENIKVVCKRFLDSSMTPDEVAERMDVRKRQSGSFQ